MILKIEGSAVELLVFLKSLGLEKKQEPKKMSGVGIIEFPISVILEKGKKADVTPSAPGGKKADVTPGAPGERMAPAIKPASIPFSGGKKKAGTSASNIKKREKAPKALKGKGSLVTLEELKQIDLSDCDSIPSVIDRLQLKTNISGSRLAELSGLSPSDISTTRKGKVYPYVERAFKQYLQFPGDPLPSTEKNLNLNT